MPGALARVASPLGGTVSSVEKEPVQRTPKIHRGWVALLAGGGVVITALAFGGRFATGVGDDDLAVWQSILTNFGVGLLSAAVLLLFEPKFRRAVTDTVNTATAGVKEEVREAIQADIDQRLAPLTERIDSLYDQKIAAQQAAVQGLAAEFSHERATKILKEAADIGALYQDSLRVQAEPVAGELHIGLQLRIPYDVQFRYRDVGYAVPPDEEEILYLSATGDRGLLVEVEWEPNEEFTVAALNLSTELSRQQRRGLNQRIDWESVLSRFEKAFKVAIDSSNKTEGALHLHGALVEVAGADSAPWYLTTEGLHYPAKDWFLPRYDIFKPAPYQAKPLVMPEWADNKEWSYIALSAVGLYSSW